MEASHGEPPLAFRRRTLGEGEAGRQGIKTDKLNGMGTILDRALEAIHADPWHRSLPALRAELNSRNRDRRVTALMRIRYQIEARGLRRGYFELASRHVEEQDSGCRWQATTVIGEFIESSPDLVWPIARELAMSPNADIRMASTTVLLEHLLEYHPSKMIPMFRAELRSGNRRFKGSVAGCSNFGNSRNRARIQELIDEARSKGGPTHRWSRLL